MLRCESVFLATRISDMVLILVLAGKSPAAKNEILRSLRSLRLIFDSWVRFLGIFLGISY
jgi:hypothetical protein